MSKKLVVSSAIAAALLASAPAHAAVSLLTSSGQITTTYLNTFESVKNSGPVTFDAGSQLRNTSGVSPSVPSGTNGLLSASVPATITANLSSYFTAVGMYFGNDDTCCARSMNAILSVFDGATLLGSVSVAGNMNDATDQFIGLSSTAAFNKVTISYGDAGLFGFIDDFRLGSAGEQSGVPEPATWAMMLLGFAVVGGAMRRSRQKQSVQYSFA